MASLVSTYVLPQAYAERDFFWQLLPVLGFDVVLLLVGCTQWQRVKLGSRWRIITIILAALMGLLSPKFLMPAGNSGAMVFVSVSLALAAGCVGFFVLVPVEIAIRRWAPAKLYTLERFFHRRVVSEPCGLAILRGTFAGLFLLGADTLLVWFGTSRLGMWLDSFLFIAMPTPKIQYYNPWVAVPLGIFQAVVLTILVAFLTSFFARIVRPVWFALLLAAALAAVIFPGPLFTMGAVEPYAAKVILLSLDFLILGWIFLRFDVLTLTTAAFTFAFFADNYALLVTFSPIGSAEEKFAFAVWGSIVTIAAAVAFKPSLIAAYRRVATAFQ